MIKKQVTMRVTRAAGMLFVFLSCCGDDDQSITPGVHTRLESGSAVVLDQQDSQAIALLLYEENLISNREVNQKVNEVVRSIPRSRTSNDSVMLSFRRWLEEWAANHARQVEGAWLDGGYSMETHSSKAEVDSMRRLQTDSIRLIVRARVMRRVSVALNPK